MEQHTRETQLRIREAELRAREAELRAREAELRAREAEIRVRETVVCAQESQRQRDELHHSVDFADTHRSIPTEESAWLTPAYHPAYDKSVSRSPILPSDELHKRPQNHAQNEASKDEGCPETPGLEAQNQHSSASQGTSRKSRGEENEEYCTQQCLLGLVNGTPLDELCPNAALHRRVEAGKHHPISHAEFVQLTYDQLKTSLDDGVVPLYLSGARGVLFRITLLAYGYTFVGKGTIEVYIPILQHEEAMYKHLKQNQGLDIPVYLGNVDLRSMDKIYYYAIRVYIVYIVLMSWAGVAIDSSVDKDKVRGCLRAIHNNGVAHTNVRRCKVLSDPRTGQVMVIDFDRASLVNDPLAQAVPNEQPSEGGGHEPKSQCQTVAERNMFAEDMAEAETILSAI